MKRRVIRQSLVDDTRAFVKGALADQTLDQATLDLVVQKVLKALPPSVRYAEG